MTTAPLTDEELRCYSEVIALPGTPWEMVQRMARELLAARGELTRWRSIGVDMVHGAMLAVAGVSRDENQAERIKLLATRDALREQLVEARTFHMAQVAAWVRDAVAEERERIVTWLRAGPFMADWIRDGAADDIADMIERG